MRISSIRLAINRWGVGALWLFAGLGLVGFGALLRMPKVTRTIRWSAVMLFA